MKQSIKKFSALVVVLALCLGIATTASARSSRYLSMYRAWLNTNSNGKIDVVVDVEATTTMDEVGASTIQLWESKDDGENWTCVRTYVKSLHPEMVDTNASFYYDIAATYNGTPGYQYYAIVAIYAGNSTGSDTRYYQTPTVTAPSKSSGTTP